MIEDAYTIFGGSAPTAQPVAAPGAGARPNEQQLASDTDVTGIFALDKINQFLTGLGGVAQNASNTALSIFDDVNAFQIAREQLERSSDPVNLGQYGSTAAAGGGSWNNPDAGNMNTQQIVLIGGFAVLLAAVLGWALK